MFRFNLLRSVLFCSVRLLCRHQKRRREETDRPCVGTVRLSRCSDNYRLAYQQGDQMIKCCIFLDRTTTEGSYDTERDRSPSTILVLLHERRDSMKNRRSDMEHPFALQQWVKQFHARKSFVYNGHHSMHVKKIDFFVHLAHSYPRAYVIISLRRSKKSSSNGFNNKESLVHWKLLKME